MAIERLYGAFSRTTIRWMQIMFCFSRAIIEIFCLLFSTTAPSMCGKWSGPHCLFCHLFCVLYSALVVSFCFLPRLLFILLYVVPLFYFCLAIYFIFGLVSFFLFAFHSRRKWIPRRVRIMHHTNPHAGIFREDTNKTPLTCIQMSIIVQNYPRNQD